MRYYDISIKNAAGGVVIPSSLQGAGFNSISSLYPGTTQTNPAALDIELDVNETASGLADTASYVRIYGLGLRDIGTSFSLGMGAAPGATNITPANGYSITLRAGMAKGLPLANPQQQGVIGQGEIWQAFGNWLLTDMTVDLYFMPSMGTSTAPLNFNFVWKPGTKLSNALNTCLGVAMPDYAFIYNASERVFPNDESGPYPSFSALALYVQGVTGPTSPINMSINPGTKTIIAYDGTMPVSSSAVKQIQFQDLIGQVTWFAPLQITAKFVMRGDLHIGDIIQFPQGLQLAMPGALQKLSDTVQFGGNFFINRVQHWGRYRQPDAASWNTTIWATAQTGSQSAAVAAYSGSSWNPPM